MINHEALEENEDDFFRLRNYNLSSLRISFLAKVLKIKQEKNNDEK